MYLWGLLCKPGRNRISPAPTLLSPPFPSPIPHHPQKATDSSMLIKSTSFSTQSDRLVPELDTIVPSESTKAYNMVDIVHAVSPTSVCLSAGLAVCMSLCFGSVRKYWALTAGTTDRAWGGTEPRHRGTCCGRSQWLWPPCWLWPMEKGPCVQSLELRWVDFTHLCLGSHAQRAFCFSRERGAHEASCDKVEGYVCRSEEHRSPLYLFLGVVGSRLIKWRGQCWSELEAPVPGHCLPPAFLCVLSSQLFSLNSAQAALWGQPLPRPGSPRGLFLLPWAVGSQRESAADPCCRYHCLLSTMWAPSSSMPSSDLGLPYSAPRSCPVHLSLSVLPFLLEPSAPSGHFLPDPAWTLTSC